MMKNLALRMRPQTINEVIGQQHLLGKGKIIRRMIDANLLSSMILYGPPGIGKTSIASAIAGSLNKPFRILNAAVNNKKDLQVVAEEAKISEQIVLLIDEIHRLDKPKQDFLLPLLENGEIILIGATTENPYFSINPAIRSRVQLFELKPLTSSDIKQAVKHVIASKKAFNFPVEITDEALNFLSQSTNGDLRSAYNSLELAVLSSAKNQAYVLINLDAIENSLQRKSITMDKDGDGHYDVLSALQKSIRGSDVNAALHYAARLVAAGDLQSLGRRLIVIAYEDIGLANPEACQRTVTAIQAAERLGFPEARIPIANIIVDLALSPKSNSAYTAMNTAIADLTQHGALEIPLHLKDSHYKAAQKIGHGVDYLYPHDYPNDWVKQDYLPEKIRKADYYQAKATGKYEQALHFREKQIKDWQNGKN
ncbi:MAG: replication-associated recombination protein A [Streptococcaceae bacterium]|nr:replication-associated recombination protein A [Streptococcaceae bacterium]